MIKFNEDTEIEEAIMQMEREMKFMWDNSEILEIVEKDREFTFTIMTALYYERKRFMKEMGIIIGEA